MDGKQYSAPPPYGFNQPAPPAAQMIYTTNTPVTVLPRPVGPHSSQMTCPSCHASICTRVETEPSTKTHLFALFLCLIFCPCGILPYCMDSCKNTNHYCPNCGCFLGTYDP